MGGVFHFEAVSQGHQVNLIRKLDTPELRVLGYFIFRTASMTPALDFSRFQAITFDCYGTLIDWETGILGAIRPILLSHGAELNDPEILRLCSELEAEEESYLFQPYLKFLPNVHTQFSTLLVFPSPSLYL